MSLREWALGAATGGSLVLPGALAGNPAAEDIPPVALAAYVNAAGLAPCPIDWRIPAAVGKVETDHGRWGGAHLKPDGDLAGTIVSPAGAGGPMQFMPETAAAYVAGYDVDGNHDGVEDLDNVFDASLAAVTKLCADGVMENATEATGRYNGGVLWARYDESRAYVLAVRSYAALLPEFDAKTMTPTEKDRGPGAFVDRQWQTFVVDPWLRIGDGLDGDARRVWEMADGRAFGNETSTPDGKPIGNKPDGFGSSPRPDMLDPDFGRGLDRMAADAPGVIGVRSGYRDAAEQRALREQNCPDPVYSPSTDCTPATAAVGSSDHEKGLAADLTFADAATEAWAHQHAGEFGLEFDLLHLGEPWHVSIRY